MSTTFKVAVAPGISYPCTIEDDSGYQIGQDVIIQYDSYEDCGVIERRLSDKTEESRPKESRNDDDKNRNKRPTPKDVVGRIIRHPNLRDQGKMHEKEAREHSMFRTAVRKVDEHNLPMKIIGCHYTFDRKLVTFQFSAEGRVDFRELVRDLAGALHCREELRQIGVRDEAAIVGGLGICGRPLCCNKVLEKFASVNVKTAKAQHLSLNPSSVSGSCGRLKCCLRYEVDWYKEAFRRLPRNNCPCKTPDGPGKVLECNALTEKAKVRLDGENGGIAEFPVDEIETGR
jgi:cell fate regulator YaaT (PSP1 superfamily)